MVLPTKFLKQTKQLELTMAQMSQDCLKGLWFCSVGSLRRLVCEVGRSVHRAGGCVIDVIDRIFAGLLVEDIDDHVSFVQRPGVVGFDLE